MHNFYQWKVYEKGMFHEQHHLHYRYITFFNEGRMQPLLVISIGYALLSIAFSLALFVFNDATLALLGFSQAVAFGIVAYGLARYREWARQLFILLLVLVISINYLLMLQSVFHLFGIFFRTLAEIVLILSLFEIRLMTGKPFLRRLDLLEKHVFDSFTNLRKLARKPIQQEMEHMDTHIENLGHLTENVWHELQQRTDSAKMFRLAVHQLIRVYRSAEYITEIAASKKSSQKNTHLSEAFIAAFEAWAFHLHELRMVYCGDALVMRMLRRAKIFT